MTKVSFESKIKNPPILAPGVVLNRKVNIASFSLYLYVYREVTFRLIKGITGIYGESELYKL